MIITKQFVKELILEELTKADVKKMIDAAIKKSEKKELTIADVRRLGLAAYDITNVIT